jgi:hypothetical protein
MTPQRVRNDPRAEGDAWLWSLGWPRRSARCFEAQSLPHALRLLRI